MSLRDAVLEIADLIESDFKPTPSDVPVFPETVLAYAKMIRLAIKASEGEQKPMEDWRLQQYGTLTGDKTIDGGVILKAHGCNPDGPARAQQKLAEARRIERAVEREDGSGVRMVEILDGNNDGLCELHPVPTSMQVGQALDIGRRVFVLTKLDNGTLQLHLHAAETERRFGKK